MSNVKPPDFNQPYQQPQTPSPQKEDGTFTKIAKKFASIFGADNTKDEGQPPANNNKTWHRR